MGADFLLASLVIDKCRSPHFVAGYAAIERLGPSDIEAPEEFFGDDPDTEGGMAAIRETLHSAWTTLSRGSRVVRSSGSACGARPSTSPAA
jgi:hypothetical protein